MSLLTRQNILISFTSGAISVITYILLKKALSKQIKRSNDSKQEQSKIYEDKVLLDQYMMFNFCEGKEMLLFDLKNDVDIRNCFLFPKRVALLCKDFCPDIFFSGNVS